MLKNLFNSYMYFREYANVNTVNKCSIFSKLRLRQYHFSSSKIFLFIGKIILNKINKLIKMDGTNLPMSAIGHNRLVSLKRSIKSFF